MADKLFKPWSHLYQMRQCEKVGKVQKVIGVNKRESLKRSWFIHLVSKSYHVQINPHKEFSHFKVFLYQYLFN